MCGLVCCFSGDVGVEAEESRAGCALVTFVQGRTALGDELPGLGAGPGPGQELGRQQRVGLYGAGEFGGQLDSDGEECG